MYTQTGKRPGWSSLSGQGSIHSPVSTRNKEWREWLQVVQQFMQAKIPARALLQTAETIDGRPHVMVSLLGINFTGLLDSGASRSMIGSQGWRKLEKLELPLRPEPHLKVTIANGAPCKIQGSVEIPVTLEGNVKIINFLVVPSLVNDIILGIDFWKEMSIVPNVQNHTWTFGAKSGNTHELLISAALVERSNLSLDQKAQLENILDYWKEVIPQKLEGTNLVEHFIDTGDNRPIKQRYYPVSPAMQTIIDEELERMIQEGVIERSSSPWSSPVVMVKKPEGKYRFCVDYRKLNAVTKRDAYPLPYVTQILDRLRDAKYLTSLDLKSAYWQIKVAEKDREKTAFTVPGRGLYQFARMPFGLHNAPATWQRFIDTILGPELEPKVCGSTEGGIHIAVSATQDSKTNATFSRLG